MMRFKYLSQAAQNSWFFLLLNSDLETRLQSVKANIGTTRKGRITLRYRTIAPMILTV